MIARLALRHGQGLVDRVGDVLVVGVREVSEELGRVVGTDAGDGVDRGQQQGLLGFPLGDEGGDVRPRGVHLPIAGCNDRLVVDIGVRAV